MKVLAIFFLAAVACVAANCGCLKNPTSTQYFTSSSNSQQCQKCCSKNLRVVSQPSCPIKVIYRYPPVVPECLREHQYQVQMPVPSLPSVTLPGKSYNYKIEPLCLNREQVIEDCQANQRHEYQVQMPLPSLPSLAPAPLTGLKFRADRVVLPAPAPINAGCWPKTNYVETFVNDSPSPVITPQNWQNAMAHLLPISHCSKPKPTCPINLEPLCDRYECGNTAKRRCKRQVDFVKHGCKFLVNMLPDFLRDPLKQTVRGVGHMQGYDMENPQKSLKEKIAEKHKNNVEKLKEKVYGLKNDQKNTYYGQGTYNNRQKKNIDSRDDYGYKYSALTDSSNNHDNILYKLMKMKHQNENLALTKTKTPNKNRNYEYDRDDVLENILKRRRSKRDIIIGGDRIAHPFYRVKENSEEQLSSEEENSIENPEYVEPDVIVGKNIIKKAIQEEMEKYHEQNRKEEMVAKPKPTFLNMIPQNPLFLMLKAPLVFLKHFDELNKGVNPLLSNLPKLVYGTKKYFRHFGRNFKKNCLNLCSDLVGDFEQSGPNFLNQILQPRFKRDLKKSSEVCEKICEENSPESTIRKKRGIAGGRNEENSIATKEDLKNIEKMPFVLKLIYLYPYKVATKPKNAYEKKLEQYEPEYSKAFEESDEENRKMSRKKRYIVQVCNEDDVHDYLNEKLTQEDYLEPLTNYYNQLNNFLNQLLGIGQNNYVASERTAYEQPKPQTKNKKKYSSRYSFEEMEDYPKKKRKVKVEKLKPRLVIDNKGLPFLEMDGMKRPLIPRGRKNNIHRSRHEGYDSSEETRDRIVGLIAHAKEKDIVGASYPNYIPLQTIRERLSSLLTEIDDLVHTDFEEYDHIFDDLIKIQHIKNSIVQDWKRVLIKDRVDDVNAKISILDKFKDLQHFKDVVVEEIAKALKKNDSKFLRKKFINCLIRLHKLQCIISSVVDDFEEHLKMHTHFNTKKEIEYVDQLSALNFANSKTRSDILKSFGKERDESIEHNIELLNKLKKMLVDCDESCEDVQKEARILWEMKNIEKLQKQTIKDMNRKLELNYKIKKELKILIDLQKRYDRCVSDQRDIFNTIDKDGSGEEKVGKGKKKKDPKKILEEIKKKYDEFLEKTKKKFEKNKNK